MCLSAMSDVTRAFNACILILQYTGASTVSEDHTVPVMLINYARQRFGTDQQHFLSHPCLEINISQYECVYPARAAYQDVVCNAFRAFDSEDVFYLTGKGGNILRLQAVVCNIPE